MNATFSLVVFLSSTIYTKLDELTLIIDILYKQIKYQTNRKPRTYRNLARKDYLLIAKQRRPSRNKKRQAIKKQLQYIKRNLAHIEQLIDSGST